MAPETIPLAPVDALRITILMDNVTDPLLLDEGPVSRVSWLKALRGPLTVAAMLEPDREPDALIAEPGFSAFVTVERAGQTHRILFDAGVSSTGVAENMRRLSIDPTDIELIVLSHGHFDHVAGMEGVVRALGRTSVPVYIHPAFWTRRRLAFPGHEPVEMPTPGRAALEGAGFEIVEGRQPSFLLHGAVLVTGEVDRTTPFEVGFRGHEAYENDRWSPDPLILDDQALIVRVRDRGLVVLTGCGHSGVVNVVRYAQALTGVDDVCAVVGGFHLSGPMFEPVIDPTVAAFESLKPSLLMPAHCTGWKAVHRLAARFPDAFVQCAVGTTVTI